MTAVATTTIGETPLAVTGSVDGQVLVWDLDTGERRHTLTGHTDWVRAVATTTIGETPVAVTGKFMTMGRSWSGTWTPANAGSLDRLTRVHTGGVTPGAVRHRRTPAHLDRPHRRGDAVATTTIGETPVAVTGSNDGQVLVWDLDTGERRHTLTGHTAG
ncbi:MAG: hypothetical protein U0Q21_01105 [Dermatophilaceae bacterium]